MCYMDYVTCYKCCITGYKFCILLQGLSDTKTSQVHELRLLITINEPSDSVFCIDNMTMMFICVSHIIVLEAWRHN